MVDNYTHTVLEEAEQEDPDPLAAYTGNLVAVGRIVAVKGNHQGPEVDTYNSEIMKLSCLDTILF